MIRSGNLVTPPRYLIGTILTTRKIRTKSQLEVNHTSLETAQSQGSEQALSRQGLH